MPVYVCICMFVYVRAYVYTYVRVWWGVYICVCVQLCVYMCLCAYLHICTYICLYLYAYAHALSWSLWGEGFCLEARGCRVLGGGRRSGRLQVLPHYPAPAGIRP
uniref:Uncharacterized protein n=1 Tax=Accipiter nisus TaxID=211598 RepID=A0A8B9MZQ8_9AVES